jgi:hypothetical protein
VTDVALVLPEHLRTTLAKFSFHKIWTTKLSTMQKNAPLSDRVKIRHKEMVDRRSKILTSNLKKANKDRNNVDIQEELAT